MKSVTFTNSEQDLIDLGLTISDIKKFTDKISMVSVIIENKGIIENGRYTEYKNMQ